MRVKSITVRVIPAEGHAEQRTVFTAPPHEHFEEAGFDTLIEHVTEYLDKKYPYWEFKLVRVGKAQLNFVYAGLREASDEGRDREQADEGRYGDMAHTGGTPQCNRPRGPSE